MQHFLLQNEIVKNKIEENIKGGIAAATSRITKHLQRHDLPEKRVKKIDKLQNKSADLVVNATHEAPKLSPNDAFDLLEIVKEGQPHFKHSAAI